MRKVSLWIVLLAIAAPVLASQPPELVLQYYHTDSIVESSFSANGLLATSGHNGLVDIWDTRTWVLLRTLQIAPRPSLNDTYYESTLLSPDGKTLLHTGNNGAITLWDTASGSKRTPSNGSTDWPASIAWSSDNRFFATGGSRTRVWNAASGAVVRSFGEGGAVAFSTDGERLAVSTPSDVDGRVRVFSVSTGKLLLTLRDKSGLSGPIAFSPDGKLIATGGEDPHWGGPTGPTEAGVAHQRKVKVWNAKTARLVRILPGHQLLDGGTLALQFLPDSRRLFSGGEGYSAIWDVRTGKMLKHYPGSGNAGLSPDSRMMIADAEVLSVEGKRMNKLQPPPMHVVALAFSPDGKTLASGEAWGQTGLRLWNTETGAQIRAMQGPPSAPSSILFLPENRVVSNSFNGVFIWNSLSGKLERKIEGPLLEDIAGKSISWLLLTPDGSKTINNAGLPFSGICQVRDATTGGLLREFKTGSEPIGTVTAFSQDGRYLVCRSSDRNALSVWDLDTAKQVSGLSAGSRYASFAAFSADGRTIAAVADQQRIVLWDRDSGTVKLTIKTSSQWPGFLTFSPDGHTLAAAEQSHVHFYSTTDGALAGSIESDATPQALAYSPDARLLAGGDSLGRVQLWDVARKKLLCTMMGFTTTDREKISQDWLSFTPDGRYKWSPGAAKLIRWRIDGKLQPADVVPNQNLSPTLP